MCKIYPAQHCKRWKCPSIDLTCALQVELCYKANKRHIAFFVNSNLCAMNVVLKHLCVFVGPLPVRPRRGKVVLLVLVVVVLLVRTVRSDSEYCPNIHFRCFTDPHNHTYSESSRQVLSTDAPVMTMTKTHAKTKTMTQIELSRRKSSCI